MDGRIITEAWQRYLSTLVILDRDLGDISRTLCSAHPGFQASVGLGQHGIENIRESAAKEVFKSLVRCASVHFGGNAGAVCIDADELQHEFQLERRNWDHFDPAAVWCHLESQYGGSKGEDLARQQIADDVVRHFSIRPDVPIKRVGGALTIEVNMYLDSTDKKYGRNRWSYGCRDSLERAFISLQKMIEAIPDFGTSAYDLIRPNFTQSSTNVEPRKQFVLADGHIKAITYNTKVELRFSDKLGNALMLFLSEHSSRLKQAA